MRSLCLIVIALLPASAAFASSAYTCTTFSHDSAYVFVTGINNKSQVVGYWEVSGQAPHAFLRESNGTMSSLKSPDGRDDFMPAGINNSGQIAGPSFIINPDGSYIDVSPPSPPDRGSWTNVQITGINDKGELVGSANNGLGFQLYA